MIFVYDEDNTFVGSYNSQRQAARELNIPRTTLQYSLYNQQPLTNGYMFSEEDLNYKGKNFPKILIFDIETAPLQAYVWSRWKQNVYPAQMKSEWFMLSWSAKWLFDSEVLSDVLTGKEAKKENDVRITKSLWKLIDEADIIIAHNAKKFDVKKINTRFILNGMEPPSPYRVIDTYVEVKKHFGFSSNKLNEIAHFFELGEKIKTSFELWKNCLAGSKKDLKQMEKYNRQDVILLEDVYVKLRPWIKSHPNLNIYTESTNPICGHCGGSDISQNGSYTTNCGKYIAFKCNSCGAPLRGRKNILSKSKKKRLIVPNVR